jgi:mono/diheme cytochrome c family protein
MVGSKWFTIAIAGALLLTLRAGGSALADSNAGAKLVAQNGCTSCHGAKFQGSAGFPPLYGIEHRRSRAQIVAALISPKAPMPNYGFTLAQAGDIADYLSSLDGGATQNQPVITIAPQHPSDYIDVSIRFPGTPPKSVTAVASMSMGHMPMNSAKVTFKRTSDPHVYTGRINFEMGGAWTVHIVYDGKIIDQPIVVGQ